MTITKTPPPLPTELWITILEYNNYNPLDLLRLQKIREIKKQKNTFSKMSKYIKRYIHSGMPVSGSVITIKSAFLAPLASAASSNSFMRNYSPKNIANECLLDAFYERLKKMNRTTRQKIIANYSGKGDKIDFSYARAFSAHAPIDDFDLAVSFATTTPFEGQFGLLSYVSCNLLNENALILAAVGKNGAALQYASFGPRNDKEVVLAAVRQNGEALRYTSSIEPRNDKEVVLAAVRQNGMALKHAFAKPRNDKAVVLAAVGQNGFALEYASTELKNDKEVVFAAARQDRRALRYAGTERKMEVILAAERQAGWPLEYSSGE